MADLAGRASTEHDTAVEHEPTPHAGAPEHAEERSNAPARAKPAFRLDGHVHVVAQDDGDSQALGQHRGERERLVRHVDVRSLDNEPLRRVDAPGCADADTDELLDADACARGRLGDRDRDVARDCLRPAPARGVPARLTEDPAAAAGDDGLDLRAAEIDPATEASAHRRRRTTSSSGRRFARALHSSAVRDSGSRGRRGMPNERTITGDSSSDSSSTPCAASRSVEPVRTRGDPLVPRREQHVLRGTPRVEGHRALARDDDRDDETRAEQIGRLVDDLGERLDA